MPRIGYARVSSANQDLDIQTARLTASGCEIVRSEIGSGASRDGRTELGTVLEFLREGDELGVHRLDRLARSTRDVLNLVHDLDARDASLRILDPDITTAGEMGPDGRHGPRYGRGHGTEVHQGSSSCRDRSGEEQRHLQGPQKNRRRSRNSPARGDWTLEGLDHARSGHFTGDGLPRAAKTEVNRMMMKAKRVQLVQILAVAAPERAAQETR